VAKVEVLILDLDDTIFSTRSIADESVSHVFEPIQDLIFKHYDGAVVDHIFNDMWKLPFDTIVQKYQLHSEIIHRFYHSIRNAEFELSIRPFEDYKFLRTIDIPKILVTTGFQNLQEAKIDALGIRDDFEEIIIDDILHKNRIYKNGIFQNILSSRNLRPGQVFVIGDNVQSELLAAYELGIPVAQMRKFDQAESDFVDFALTDYRELLDIIRSS